MKATTGKCSRCQAVGGWRSQTRAFDPDAKGDGEPLKAFRQGSDKISLGRTLRKTMGLHRRVALHRIWELGRSAGTLSSELWRREEREPGRLQGVAGCEPVNRSLPRDLI